MWTKRTKEESKDPMIADIETVHLTWRLVVLGDLKVDFELYASVLWNVVVIFGNAEWISDD